MNVTGNGTWSLFRNPAQLARLVGDPSLVPVLEDVEVCGATVPKGAELGPLFGSANRDPAVFDRPDELDVAREPNPSVSFGAGVHFCLGAPLAHLELETSFSTVIRSLPGLHLIEEPTRKSNDIIRGLRELRVSGTA